MDAPLILDTNLNLQAASTLRIALLERQGNDIILDASRVERLGGLCLQVLISARDAWRLDGLSMSLQNVSEDVKAQLSLLGADDLC